jgi:hypothetical protein
VGSAGATGSGEENIKVAGAHTIVENMRRGMSPQEAGMDALKRIVRNYNGDMRKLRFVDMTLLHPAQRRRLRRRFTVGRLLAQLTIHKIAVHDGTKRAGERSRSAMSQRLLAGFSSASESSLRREEAVGQERSWRRVCRAA